MVVLGCFSSPSQVDLKLCGTVKSADDLTNQQFTFTVQVPERNFFLQATCVLAVAASATLGRASTAPVALALTTSLALALAQERGRAQRMGRCDRPRDDREPSRACSPWP